MEPGFQFHAVPLERTTYYGTTFETEPLPISLYVVCENGSIQDVRDPTHRIGWTLHVLNGEYYYCSFGQYKRCHVRPHGTYPCLPPKGKDICITIPETLIWAGTPPR